MRYRADRKPSRGSLTEDGVSTFARRTLRSPTAHDMDPPRDLLPLQRRELLSRGSSAGAPRGVGEVIAALRRQGVPLWQLTVARHCERVSTVLPGVGQRTKRSFGATRSQSLLGVVGSGGVGGADVGGRDSEWVSG